MEVIDKFWDSYLPYARSLETSILTWARPSGWPASPLAVSIFFRDQIMFDGDQLFVLKRL